MTKSACVFRGLLTLCVISVKKNKNDERQKIAIYASKTVFAISGAANAGFLEFLV